jgi:predicted GNAT superfamily acetyltransferase
MAMPGLQISPLSMADAMTQDALRALNNANARETSYLTPEEWRALIAATFSATCIGPEAFLTTLDQDADYGGVNFNWFKQRYSRFVYIDSIVVAESLRVRGVGRLLYSDLFERLRAADQNLVGCEVNLTPPNAASDAFHARMGFVEAGRAVLPGGSKTVRYFIKSLD